MFMPDSSIVFSYYHLDLKKFVINFVNGIDLTNRRKKMSRHLMVTSNNKPLKVYTLIVVRNEGNVLLGFKKRGFGVNMWNGFGGKVEPGESISDSAIRELKEECGLTTTTNSLFKHGVLWFEHKNIADVLHEVHLFSVCDYEGDVTESDEMKPKWFSVKDLPFHTMWPSNRYWLPLAISGVKFDAFFSYQSEKELIDYTIKRY